MKNIFPLCGNEAEAKAVGQTRGMEGSINQRLEEGSRDCHWILEVTVLTAKTKRCGCESVFVFLESRKEGGFVIALFHEEETERTKG